MFYTITCPNCRVFQRMLDELLPQYGDKYTFKKTLVSTPIGMIRTMKLGIHTVPTVLIDNRIVFRSVPEKQDLINRLNQE
ncbi:thioredoxin family protein [Candidatus Neomarinimicrobiota bacterium]